MEQVMTLTNKTAGLGLVAVAALMLGTAAIADNMGQMRMGDGMGMGMGMRMGEGPALDLAAIDADKDGKISKDEMTAYHEARVAGVDANKDGKLSADELAAMHLQEMTDAVKTMAGRMIERLDTDGDGLLSAAEMASRPMPADMFDRVDTNGDGFIDQSEIDAAKARMSERGDRMGGHGWHFKGGERGKGNDDD
jgi:Ca2+-binding EF-hand superfamily protein